MIGRTGGHLALAATGAVLLAAAGVWGQASGQPEAATEAATTQAANVRPKTRVSNCLTGGCHRFAKVRHPWRGPGALFRAQDALCRKRPGA